MNSIINQALNVLAEKHNINTYQLKYIGHVDCSWKKLGAVQLQFNIECEGHRNNHSTVAVNSWNM